MVLFYLLVVVGSILGAVGGMAFIIYAVRSGQLYIPVKQSAEPAKLRAMGRL